MIRSTLDAYTGSSARYEGAGSIRSSSSSNPLFHAYDGKAAAVFIDSESKVVDRVRYAPIVYDYRA